MKKIFAFDLDGTLLNSQNRILESTIKALELVQQNGDEIIFATGRNLRITREILKYYPNLKINYLVCSNGGVILDLDNKKIHYLDPVGNEVASKYLEVAEKNKDMIFIASGIKTAYIPMTYSEEFIKNIYTPMQLQEIHAKAKFIDPKELFSYLENDISVQYALRGTEDKILKLYHQFSKEEWAQNYNFVITNKVFLDVNNKFASKYFGLKNVIHDFLNLQKHEYELYAFGDSDNDYEMLKHADYSYAMANSTPKLMSIVKKAIGSNNEPSIADEIFLAYKK